MKYLKRLISYPFVLALFLISAVWCVFVQSYRFFRYGSEYIIYDEPQTRIHHVYDLLREEYGYEDFEEERAVGGRAPL